VSEADYMIQDHLDRLMDAGDSFRVYRRRMKKKKRRSKNEQSRKNTSQTPKAEVSGAEVLSFQEEQPQLGHSEKSNGGLANGETSR
jgi:hypothetical protein